jgi:hypothetical protein
MSCISEILKVKGDKEFLRVGDEIVIEDGGNYKGYEYLITFSTNGFRCGYVAIDTNHPTYHDSSDYPDYSVHGGITFFDKSHLAESILGHTCTDKWLGFNAGHSCDLSDIDSVNKYFPTLRMMKLLYLKKINETLCKNIFFDSSIRTKEYMIDECKKLIDQLIEKDSEEHEIIMESPSKEAFEEALKFVLDNYGEAIKNLSKR